MRSQVTHKNTKTKPYNNEDTLVQCMSISDAWQWENTAKDVGTPNTLKGYAKATVDWCHKRLTVTGIE